MSVFWLMPAAGAAIALVAVPVIIHLLARQRSRRLLFPSLKFLPVAQLAALRRRTLADWPLLLLRVLIIAAAVAAMAGPVVVSDARRGAWNQRVARAVVVSDDGPDVTALASEVAQDSFVSETFSALTIADGIRAASEWLRVQPPAAREVVVVGDLRERALASRDFAVLAPHVGVRFVPVTRQPVVESARIRAYGDTAANEPGTFAIQVSPELTETRVLYSTDAQAPARIRVMASADEQWYADAVLRAVLRDGVVVGADEHRAVTIVFEGGSAVAAPSSLQLPGPAWMRDALAANPEVRGGEAGGELIVRANMRITDERAPHVVAGVVRSALAPQLDHIEPRRVPAAMLAQWSRPHGGSPPDALPADEGDRRWLWGAVLALLVVEQLARGRKRIA